MCRSRADHLKPQPATVIQLCPFPFRLFYAAIRWWVHKLMFVPVAAFSRRAADLGLGVFPEEPSAPKWLLEDVAFIGNAGREVIIEDPAIPQQSRIVDAQTFATPAAIGR